MNNKKILVILLITALSLTMVSISSFAYAPKQGNFSGYTATPNRFAGQGQGFAGKNFTSPVQNDTPRGMFNLELSAEQQAEMREMMLSFQKETLELRNQIQLKQLEMRELRLADELDMEQVKSKLEEIADLQVELRMKAVERQDKVKELLTPEQLENCAAGFQMQGFNMGNMGNASMNKGFNPGFNQQSAGNMGNRGNRW
jgi:Spy/CpxP family protein refolding chaperone